MVPSVFDPFLNAGPFCVLTRAAVESLYSPERLDELFKRTAQTQYTRELLFSQLVELMSAVVLQQQPSVRAAYLKGVGNVTVSDQAVYDKLNHLELGLSAALVRDSAQRITPVIDALKAKHPSWLRGYRVRILDGNALSATERRLVELQDTWDAPLPGRVLAVLDQRTGLVEEVFLTPDGHDQERSLIGDVLRSVRNRDLWIADRNFCTRGFLFGLDCVGAAFVIREHGKFGGTPVGPRKMRGRCETGRVSEQSLRVVHEDREWTLRRVTIELDTPTRDQDRVIHILTNLPVSKASGRVVGELYRKRWTIEGRFLEMSQTLNAEPQTFGYPKAALFAFCLGLVASNAVALLKSAVRSAHGKKAESELSSYAVALDIQQLHRGMMVAVVADQWALFARMTTAELAATLKEMALRIDLERYRKTTRGPKKPKTRKKYNNGGHVSTHRLLLKRTQ